MAKQSRLSILESQFADHKTKEEGWQKGIDVWKGEVDKTLLDMNSIRLNGDEKAYTHREAMEYIAHAIAPTIRRRKFFHMVLGIPRPVRWVLYVALLYLFVSLLNDLHIIEAPPLQLMQKWLPWLKVF